MDAPGQSNAGIDGVIHHQVVQSGAAQAEAVAIGETRFDAGLAVGETNAAEGMSTGGLQVDAERAGGGQAIGHDAFTAGLVDGRNGAIGESDVEAAAARGDGGGEPSRSAADDEQVGGAGQGTQWVPPAASRRASSCR